MPPDATGGGDLSFFNNIHSIPLFLHIWIFSVTNEILIYPILKAQEDSVAAPGELHRPWIDQNGRMLHRSGWRALFWSLTTFLRAFSTHDWCKWSSALACCFFPRAEIALPSHYIKLWRTQCYCSTKLMFFFMVIDVNNNFNKWSDESRLLL